MTRILKQIALPAFFALFLLIPAAYAAEESPLEIAGSKTVTAEEAKAMFDEGVVFIDVRGDSDWEAGRIAGAEHLSVKDGVLNEQSLLDLLGSKETPVLFYCNGVTCMLSADATTKAVEWGFTNVNRFRTGFPSWKEAGYPVE